MKSIKVILILIVATISLLSCKEEKTKKKVTKKTEQVEKVITPKKIIKPDVLLSLNDYKSKIKNTNIKIVDADFGEALHFDGEDKNYLILKTPKLTNKSSYTINFNFSINEKNFNKNNTLINLLDFKNSKGRYGKTLLSLWFSKRRISAYQNGKDLRKQGEIIDRKGFSEEFLTSQELDFDQTYNLTYAYRPGTVKIYIDGELYSQYNNVKSANRTAIELLIGKTWSNNKSINNLIGEIGEIKIYINKFLEPKQI